MKKIAILGSTGSIGTQTLDVISSFPDRFEVVGLAAGSNCERIVEQAQRFQPRILAVASKEIADQIRLHLPEQTRLYYGMQGLLEIATMPEADVLVTAIVGSIGLRPTLAAIAAGKNIALANKETLVTAGKIVLDAVQHYNVELLPVDSEHSAILQCLQGENKNRVEEIILTASGGSLRHKTREELVHVTVQDALKHPNWSMGAKITIDSATMMNKGLEVIEAHWLFNIDFERIRVLLHEESLIHSMVVYEDSSVIAQLGTPDMRVPIQYALSYPDRFQRQGERLNLAKVGMLHFKEMDFERFPCLQLAIEAGQKGGTYPAVLNAANEIAVQRFLDEQLSFLGIEKVIYETLEQHTPLDDPNLDDIEQADEWARQIALSLEGR